MPRSYHAGLLVITELVTMSFAHRLTALRREPGPDEDFRLQFEAMGQPKLAAHRFSTSASNS